MKTQTESGEGPPETESGEQRRSSRRLRVGVRHLRVACGSVRSRCDLVCVIHDDSVGEVLRDVRDSGVRGQSHGELLQLRVDALPSLRRLLLGALLGVRVERVAGCETAAAAGATSRIGHGDRDETGGKGGEGGEGEQKRAGRRAGHWKCSTCSQNELAVVGYCMRERVVSLC